MSIARSRPLLVAAVALAMAGCGGGPNRPSASPVALPSSATALPTFSATQFRELLTTLKGKPVVVNVWASWCSPCTREAPSLAQVSAQYAGSVQFLGVAVVVRPTLDRRLGETIELPGLRRGLLAPWIVLPRLRRLLGLLVSPE